MNSAQPSPIAVLRPAPSALDAWISVLEALRDPVAVFRRQYRERGELVAFRIGTFRTHLAISPRAISSVLQHPAMKKDRNTLGTAWFLGNGLVTAQGETWAHDRRELNPDFALARVRELAPAMERRISQCLDRWPSQGEADIGRVMAGLTLRIVCDPLFGPEVDCSLLEECLPEWSRFFERPLNYFLFRRPWLPTPSHSRVRALNRRFERWLADLISGRGESLSPDSWTARWIREGLAPSRPGGIRDHVATMIIAGHETTATALAWAFSLLARHPAHQERIRAEVRAIRGRSGSLSELVTAPSHARSAILETLRLYPSIWCMGREAGEDLELCGRSFRKGDHFSMPVALIHRQEDSFPDPDSFRPERWEGAAHPRYAYVPFGGGPRACIGQTFALQEMILTLALALERFSLDATDQDGKPVPMPEPFYSITMRPRTRPLLRIAALPEAR